MNAYGLTKVLEAGNKIKIIIVMDYQTIQSEPDKLYQIVYQLERLFGSEFYSVINSCVLVVTKANKEEDDGLKILIDQLKRKS